jgi:hypothetical protein
LRADEKNGNDNCIFDYYLLVNYKYWLRPSALFNRTIFIQLMYYEDWLYYVWFNSLIRWRCKNYEYKLHDRA